MTGYPGHVPARQGVAVDGKERKGAKAGGSKKVHLPAAVTHTPGIVIGQDKAAKSGRPPWRRMSGSSLALGPRLVRAHMEPHGRAMTG
ncbi:MAG: hypothetical protein ACRDOH_34225 [Streptosporangiaceae bacterium]